MMFLAACGEVSVPAAGPLLPAENTTRYGWLPATFGSASRVRASHRAQVEV